MDLNQRAAGTPEPNGESISIKIKGKIDRIEEVEGQTYIIDYKSGMVLNRDLNATDAESILESSDGRYAKQLQLLTYQLLYDSNSSGNSIAGIISFRNMKGGLINMSEPKEDLGKEVIQMIVEEMLDPEIAFEHNSSFKYCNFPLLTSIQLASVSSMIVVRARFSGSP